MTESITWCSSRCLNRTSSWVILMCFIRSPITPWWIPISVRGKTTVLIQRWLWSRVRNFTDRSRRMPISWCWMINRVVVNVTIHHAWPTSSLPRSTRTLSRSYYRNAFWFVHQKVHALDRQHGTCCSAEPAFTSAPIGSLSVRRICAHLRDQSKRCRLAVLETTQQQ